MKSLPGFKTYIYAQTRPTAAKTAQQVRTSIRDLCYHRARCRHVDECHLAPKVRQQLLKIQWVKRRKVKQHRMPEPLAPSLQPLTHQLATIHSPPLGGGMSLYPRDHDLSVSVSPVRSASGQRFFYDSSTPHDSPLPFDEC